MMTRRTASTAMGDISDVCWEMTLLDSELQDSSSSSSSVQHRPGMHARRRYAVEQAGAKGSG